MLCCIVQKKISDSGGCETQMAAEVKRHIRRCPKCRSYMNQFQLLHQTLAVKDADSVEIPPFLHGRVMNGVKLEQAKVSRARNLSIRYACAAASLVVITGLVFALRGGQSAADMRVAGYDEKEWSSFGTLDQIEELVGEGPDVLSQPLSAELRFLAEDLMSVAEKLDYHLGGSFFTALASGSS